MKSPNRVTPILDSWREPASEVRIAVEAWLVQQPITQYVERAPDPQMVWNYLRRIGPVAVLRKIRSRLAERRRNRKVAGIGVGRIVDAPDRSGFKPGQAVTFFAPNHSPDWPRVCIDARLVLPAGEGGAPLSERSGDRVPDLLQPFIGWTRYSGLPLDAATVGAELRRIAQGIACAGPNTIKAANAEVRENSVKAGHGRPGRPTAVLFGLGNYAKTQIIPHIRRQLDLAAIHEIDPDQISAAAGLGTTLDTCPWPRDGDRFDAWFIAGFHHSHASLAVQALKQGAYAIVEKPLVTTREQYAEVIAALTAAGSNRLVTCFHRRYSVLNEWARRDLQVPVGDPVDMHCLVYEIPLPPLHWYNWPNSGSRIVSNGCHWLDYFMFINGFSAVTRRHARRLRNRDFAVTVQLENGANLVMSLTDTGSQRLGVRDVVELRAGQVTVRIVDSMIYDSESTSRVLQRHRINPLDAFGRMYGDICRRVVKQEGGDSTASLASTVLMLDLEDELRAQA